MRFILGIWLALLLGGGTAATLIVMEPWAGPERHGYVVLADDPAFTALAADVEPTFLYSHAVSGFAADLTDAEAEALAAQPGVSVEPDIEFEAFDDLPTGVDRVDAERYWGTGRGAGVTVAVLDTGIAQHSDLEVLAALSRDFTGKGSWNDGYGHGTHVAGIIAARDDGVGVVGVAPRADLAAVKVLSDSGRGYLSWIIAGLDWAIGHRDRIDIVNMSLGASVIDRTTCATGGALHTAICNAVDAGIVVVVAAGNSNLDAENTVPATYAEVLTVSALADSDGQPGGIGPPTERYGPDDTLAGFSNWGEDVDLAAPGVDIRSTFPDGAFAVKSGTSMAAPHVAGLVALYIEEDGKPTDAAGVRAVHAGLQARAGPQGGPCGFTGDRDDFAEPVALAVTCPESPGPTPTPTPEPGGPPSDVRVRTECPGDEVNVIVSWRDNSPNESWFGVFVTDEAGERGLWRGSVVAGAMRFLWDRGTAGQARQVIVGAYVSGYRWSPWAAFTVECPEGPEPTPTPRPTATPEPGCPELDRLRDLACEGFAILFPDAEVCE